MCSNFNILCSRRQSPSNYSIYYITSSTNNINSKNRYFIYSRCKRESKKTSKNLVKPVLFEKDGKKYKLLTLFLVKRILFIFFPSKQRRYIELESIKKYINRNYEEVERILLPYKKENIEPKVSFHPKNKTRPLCGNTCATKRRNNSKLKYKRRFLHI